MQQIKQIQERVPMRGKQLISSGMVAIAILLFTGSANATTIPLTDDDTANVGLGFSFDFFGTSYSSIWVNSNGSITFGAGDPDWTESVGEFLDAPPRIGGVWDDLNPQQGGTVDATGDATQMVVSWIGVPEFFDTGSNNFDITIRSDGTISINFGAMTLTDGIVGISDGLLGPDPGETDFSATGGTYSNTVTRYEHFTFGGEFDLVGSQLNFVNVNVPEPGTLALLGIGLAGMGLARRRRKV